MEPCLVDVTKLGRLLHTDGRGQELSVWYAAGSYYAQLTGDCFIEEFSHSLAGALIKCMSAYDRWVGRVDGERKGEV